MLITSVTRVHVTESSTAASAQMGTPVPDQLAPMVSVRTVLCLGRYSYRKASKLGGKFRME